jgi:hypothetical protein
LSKFVCAVAWYCVLGTVLCAGVYFMGVNFFWKYPDDRQHELEMKRQEIINNIRVPIPPNVPPNFPR